MTFVNTIKKIWGSDSSKGFRRAAWIVAIGAFGVLTYWEYKPVITNHGNTANPTSERK